MVYTASVLPIMLASPGDVSEERRAARDALHEWNYVHSLRTNVVLMPVGWETHSAPDLAGRAQELINDRILTDCDLLVAIFWTRLGTPTGISASGTVEEIERHLEAGKPAMVYFSTKPVAPQSIDQTQFNALKEFRTWCEKKGLIETYENLDDFRNKLGRQLQIQLAKNPYLQELLERASPTNNCSVLNVIPAIADPKLTGEAKELLLEASQDRGGIIMKVVLLTYRFFQTNGKKLGLSTDRREFVRWEHALNELIDAGLVVRRDDEGRIFEVTEPGYQLCDSIKK